MSCFISNRCTIDQEAWCAQIAWKEDGEVKGLCEISIITPSEMPHYVRE